MTCSSSMSDFSHFTLKYPAVYQVYMQQKIAPLSTTIIFPPQSLHVSLQSTHITYHYAVASSVVVTEMAAPIEARNIIQLLSLVRDLFTSQTLACIVCYLFMQYSIMNRVKLATLLFVYKQHQKQKQLSIEIYDL